MREARGAFVDVLEAVAGFGCQSAPSEDSRGLDDSALAVVQYRGPTGKPDISPDRET